MGTLGMLPRLAGSWRLLSPSWREHPISAQDGQHLPQCLAECSELVALMGLHAPSRGADHAIVFYLTRVG